MTVSSPSRLKIGWPWLVFGLALMLRGGANAGATAGPAEPLAAGERIYLDGMLSTGRPLHGRREDGGEIEGAQAACVNCHRRSGLGTFEGVSQIPPITVKYLRRSTATNANDLEMAHLEGYRQRGVPYDDDTLARALRAGVASDGRALGVLMPRYDLDEREMRDLIAYLDRLGAGAAPGVSETTLQFATIITPDADPLQREAMLSVMQRFFTNQSQVIAAESRPMKASREISYRVTRQWRLHVWDLQGDSSTWAKQLHEHMAAEPVFAVVSGLGRSTWAPVHQFCETEHVPCLFPNVDVPVSTESDFYSVYFSRGVLLEADLAAGWLAPTDGPAAHARRLIQVYRQDGAGVAGAAALRAATTARHWEVVDRTIPRAAGPKQLAAAVTGLRPDDVLALWLGEDDLRALPAEPPAAVILVSGLMGGLESAPLPEAWRKAVHMTYPIDLPERRMARMNFPYGWFKVQHLPILSERVQIDTYLACVITSETVGHLFDSFVPDFLVERMEMMVGRRLANAYFPRLGLAARERFASKGGYVVHFDVDAVAAAMPATADARSSHGKKIVADTEWMTP